MYIIYFLLFFLLFFFLVLVLALTNQIVSRKQLLSAIFKAVTGLANNALKTPNVHSEIVASLNPSSNVRHHFLAF